MVLTKKSFCFAVIRFYPFYPCSNKGFAFNFKSILTGIKKDKGG